MTGLRAFLLVFVTAPAAAFYVDASVKQTSGSDGYIGTIVEGEMGQGDLSLRPSWQRYESDSSGGVFHTLSARAGYANGWLDVGATGGGTGRVNGYRNRFVGADATLYYHPFGADDDEEKAPGARGKGKLRLSAGGAYEVTRHYDELEAVPGTRRRAARRASTLEIDQSDATASAGVSLLGNALTLDVMKSRYSRDVTPNSVRQAQLAMVRGVSSTVQGFPDTTTTARFETSVLPFVTPYVQYQRTRFEAPQPDGRGATLGGAVELGLFELSASWQHYEQDGFADQDYYSLGGALKF